MVCGFAVLFAVVAVRAGQLTVLHGQRLARLAHQQQHRQVDVMPRRGPIVDRAGELLALTVNAESVYAHPNVLRGAPENIALLADALELSADAVRQKVAGQASFVWLKRVATPRQVTAARAIHRSSCHTVGGGERGSSPWWRGRCSRQLPARW